MAKLVLSAAPASTPISLADAKAHLRWDDANDNTSFDSDAQLTSLIARALDIAETETHSRFYTQTWDEYFDGFSNVIRLRVQPVQSITSITYYDAGGTLQTLSTDVYELGQENGAGVVRLKYMQTWPTTWGHEDCVIVKSVCGYGLAASVPESIKLAMLVLVTWLSTHRGDDDATLPRQAREMLSQYTFRAMR